MRLHISSWPNLIAIKRTIFENPLKIPLFDLSMASKSSYMVPFMDNKFSEDSYFAPMHIWIKQRTLPYFMAKMFSYIFVLWLLRFHIWSVLWMTNFLRWIFLFQWNIWLKELTLPYKTHFRDKMFQYQLVFFVNKFRYMFRVKISKFPYMVSFMASKFPQIFRWKRHKKV